MGLEEGLDLDSSGSCGLALGVFLLIWVLWELREALKARKK